MKGMLMLAGLEGKYARRMWFVPGFNVWGLPGLGEIEYVVQEQVGATSAAYYAQTDIGDCAQSVRFGDLSDHRGNRLPESIASARVIPRQKDGNTVFVLGEETARTFKIARDADTTAPVSTDLLIIEMGD